MPAVNYVIYGSPLREQLQEITIQELHAGKKHCCSYYSKEMVDDR